MSEKRNASSKNSSTWVCFVELARAELPDMRSAPNSNHDPMSSCELTQGFAQMDLLLGLRSKHRKRFQARHGRYIGTLSTQRISEVSSRNTLIRLITQR